MDEIAQSKMSRGLVEESFQGRILDVVLYLFQCPSPAFRIGVGLFDVVIACEGVA